MCHGTRTASWAVLRTPSDCAVPERFTFRFDRRLTAGESAEDALHHVDSLESVKAARDKGFIVDVRVPPYNDPTWKASVFLSLSPHRAGFRFEQPADLQCLGYSRGPPCYSGSCFLLQGSYQPSH